jgi:hypothetical protein
MGEHVLQREPRLQLKLPKLQLSDEWRYRWSQLREIGIPVMVIFGMMVAVVPALVIVGTVELVMPDSGQTGTQRSSQAELRKSPITPEAGAKPATNRPAPTAIRTTMVVKGYTHPVIVERLKRPTRMQVRVSALNVRGVPTTKANKPVQAPWPKGKRVTITAVAWAQNSAVDGKTKWAFTSEKRWMWYGGLKVAGPLAKATVNLAGKGPIRLKDLPILSHRASDDYMPANHPRTATERSAAIAKAQAIGKQLLARWGWSGQWNCYNSLIKSESGWKWWIDNPISSAYGIPQSLPGTKMRSAGADWRTNPVTQIIWGLDYIKKRFGTPCEAWEWKKSHGWY